LFAGKDEAGSRLDWTPLECGGLTPLSLLLSLLNKLTEGKRPQIAAKLEFTLLVEQKESGVKPPHSKKLHIQ